MMLVGSTPTMLFSHILNFFSFNLVLSKSADIGALTFL
jgi:hypothetical protein